MIPEASSLIYLFARLKLGWTEQDYTTWTAIGSVGTSFATFIVVTLLSYNWKIHDTLIGALGAFFGVFARITLAFANYSWEMYLGNYLLYRILNLLPNRSIKKIIFPSCSNLNRIDINHSCHDCQVIFVKNHS